MAPPPADLSEDYIAELLKRDAKNILNQQSTSVGTLASRRPASNTRRPNLRFLNNIIRETDSHNSALKLRELEQAGDRLRQLRGDPPRADSKRRRRDDEDRNESSSSKRRRRSESRDAGDRATRKEERRRQRSRSRSPGPKEWSSSRGEVKRHRDKVLDIDYEYEHETTGRLSRSPERKPKDQHAVNDETESDHSDTQRHRRSRRRRHRRRRSRGDRSRSRSRSRSRDARRKDRDLDKDDRHKQRYRRSSRERDQNRHKSQRDRSKSPAGQIKESPEVLPSTPQRRQHRDEYPQRRESSDHWSPPRTSARPEPEIDHYSPKRSSTSKRSSTDRYSPNNDLHSRKKSIDRYVPRKSSAEEQPIERRVTKQISPPTSTQVPAPAADGLVVRRGRGAHTSSASAMDARFLSTYDPKTDTQPDTVDDADDWERGLEAVRDRAQYKSVQTERLRAAGFSEEDIIKWERGKQEENVKWKSQGEGREWDRGKIVQDDGTVAASAEWAHETIE